MSHSIRDSDQSRLIPVMIVLSVVIPLIAISNQSLWIDEANSAAKAVQTNFASFVRVLTEAKGSDLQMPLYMAWLWLWEKGFGHSEYALRAANLPWFVFAQASLLFGFRKMGMFTVFGMALLPLIHPFVWSYLDEARPYLLQYCGGCLMAVGIMRLTLMNENSPAELWLVSAGAVLTGGASLLGVPFAGCTLAVSVAFLFYRPERERFWEKLLPIMAGASALALLAIFYLWTLQHGARASAGVGGTSISSIVFAGYELLGFMGLGPGRLAIRSAPLAAFKPWLLILACAAPVILFSIGLGFWRSARAVSRGALIAWSTCVLLPVLFVVCLGFAKNFRVLGRHFMPALPWLLIAVALGLFGAGRAGLWLKSARIALPLMWLLSALTFRFAPRHAKDDYRAAAQFANQELAKGRTVVWAASPEGAQYYKLPLSLGPPEHGKAWYPLSGPEEKEITIQGREVAREKADVIVLSKPDIYDSGGRIRELIDTTPYARRGTAMAFEFWQR